MLPAAAGEELNANTRWSGPFTYAVDEPPLKVPTEPVIVPSVSSLFNDVVTYPLVKVVVPLTKIG